MISRSKKCAHVGLQFFESNSIHEQATAGRCLLGAAIPCQLARSVITKSKGTDQIVHGPVDDLIEPYRNSDNTVDGPWLACASMAVAACCRIWVRANSVVAAA